MVLSPGFSLPDASLSNFLPVLHPSPAATSPAATVTPWTVAPPLPAVLVSSSPLASLPIHLPWSTEAAAVARRQLLTSFSGHPCPCKEHYLFLPRRSSCALCVTAAAAAAVGTTVIVSTDPPAPRSQTTVLTQKTFPVVEQGWQKVESRKSHRRRLKAAATPRRPLFQLFLAFAPCFPMLPDD
jgi:hypothetical protein